MRHNMGNVERGIRVVVGLLMTLVSLVILNGFGIFYGAVSGVTVLGFVLTLAGITVFITGITGYCPINGLLHVNSCKACKVGEQHTHMPV